MKRQKHIKSIKLKDLEMLVKDENSCIFLRKMKEHLALHPFHLINLKASVKEILDHKVAKFCPSLDGVLCGYKNVIFLSDVGKISADWEHIHLDIEADFYIFKPAPQKLLEGVVNKLSKDHVGCLVHNLFNISLPKPKHSSSWIGETLDVQDKIIVKINDSNFDGKLPYVRGEIISLANKQQKLDSLTALETETEPIEKSDDEIKKKTKKRKHQTDGEELDSHRKKRKSSGFD